MYIFRDTYLILGAHASPLSPLSRGIVSTISTVCRDSQSYICIFRDTYLFLGAHASPLSPLPRGIVSTFSTVSRDRNLYMYIHRDTHLFLGAHLSVCVLVVYSLHLSREIACTMSLEIGAYISPSLDTLTYF